MKNKIEKINKKIFLLCLVLFLGFNLYAKNDDAVFGVDRYAIFVGSNIGGENNQRLLYAGTDAISFQKTMTEIGGIPKSQGILLLDPSKDDLDNAMRTVSEMIEKNKKKSRRAEFVFYYSGHSDETALLLGKTSYKYSILKESISKVPSDVHVVILDSCYSGSFIRAKGGQKQKPFLVDDSSVVKGHAYLSSSSSKESSQESDEIESSFFTNAMITGLRGAADSSGDKKVTLNELYSYAFNETLSKTENTTTGPQHPNYNITLVGSGDLVLSDISASDSIVMLAKDLSGRVIIRDKNGKLVSEVNKIYEVPVFLALVEGQYAVTVIGEKSTQQGNFYLNAKKTYVVSNSNLSPVVRVANRNRGQNIENTDSTEIDENNNLELNEQETMFVPFVFSFVNNEFYSDTNKDIIAQFGLGLIRSDLYRVEGVMLSGIGNDAKIIRGIEYAGIYNTATSVYGVQNAGIYNLTQELHGFQQAGIFNRAQDVIGAQGAGIVNIAQDIKGVQGAGIANYAKNIYGVQGAGIANIAKDAKYVQASGFVNVSNNLTGIQVGVVNICVEELNGIQLGLVNISKNGVLEIGTSYTTNNNLRTIFNSGSKYLYTAIGFATAPKYFFNYNYDDKAYIDLIAGLGTRLEVGKFNFDLEVLSNSVINIDEEKDDDEKLESQAKSHWYPSTRISVGFTPVKHIKFFAGAMVSYEFDWNQDAFSCQRQNYKITAEEVKLYPEFDFGIRFSIN